MMQNSETRLDGNTLVVRIPMRFQRRGGRKRIVAPDRREIAPTAKPQPDGELVVAAMKVVHPEQAWKTGGCPPSAPKPELRMNIHKNARTTPHSRLLMVRRVREQKQPAARVAADFGVSERTVRKWLARWRAGGEPALNDRSSAPARQRRLAPERVAAIEALRRQRLTSPVIARRLGLPLSTVGGILRRLGLGRLQRLDPPVPAMRYQRERPGELIHIDTKKLGRIAGIGHRITGRRSGMINRHRGIGWEYLHVAVDDASRLAYTEILPDERKASALAFLERALAWFVRHGITVERIMTDNGSAYRSHGFRAACASAGVRHLRTKPYTPRTNGKAERFLQTVMRECAYARAFRSSQERAAALPRWLHLYNVHRPHTALAGQPPISRLAMNNLLGNDN
jgi:transposase InsO family protein